LKISLKVLVLEQNVALELIETWPFRTIWAYLQVSIVNG
jgi:hypothetical protein